MSNRFTLSAASAFVALIVLTPVAGGATVSSKPGQRIPNTAGVYAACYRVGTGALRMISTSRRCRAIEQRVTWNRRGPIGPQGSPGTPGAVGSVGQPGATGPVGSPGPAGAAGPAGPVGATGPAGDTGETGPAGPSGEPGSAGPAGAAGATGPPGPSDSPVLAPASSTSAAGANSGTVVSAVATCPAGKKILGGGGSYSVSNAAQTNRVVVVGSYPSAGDAWTVTVRVNQNLGGTVTATVSAYAVCTV